MSTVDPSIPLSGNSGFDVGKMLSLASMAQQMRQQQTQMQKQNALSGLLADPQSYNPDGTVSQNALPKIMSASPQVGIEMNSQGIQERLRKAQEQHYATESGRASFDFMTGIAGTAYDAYTEALKTSGGNEQAARAAATKARNAAVDASGGMLSEQQANGIRGTEWDPVQGKAFASMNKDWIAGNRAQSVAEMSGRKQDDVERGLADREREDRARDRREEERLNKPPGSTKPPAGFEWDPEHPDTLRTIKGGPKDPDAKKPWTGREKVYTERILGSANQAATAIQNITELPVSADSGIMGIGGHTGGSLFSASFGALKNKMSSQEVQDYITMLAGVKRNLAAIETMGLAPAGALTESMASLELRPGDTQITKLRKLAEMRQIVEKGMDVPLADPAIPPEIKSLATKVVDTVTKAVPYTQADVTKLQRDGEKNPNMTLAELMKNQGLAGKDAKPGEGPAAPKPATKSDIQAVASKAEYDSLPKGALYSKPGDPPGSHRVKQ